MSVAQLPLNHDAAWYMSVARRILKGEHLYRDIIDVDPPLIVYLSMLPVLLSDVLGLSDSVGLKAVISGMVAVAIPWHIRLSFERVTTLCSCLLGY